MNNPNFTLVPAAVPVGSVVAYAGNAASFKSSPPPTQPIESFGWMLCDGSELEVSQYPELFQALGYLYGEGSAGNDKTFFLPDLSGQFLRGIGTDSASNENRVAAKNGTANGVGSTQPFALQVHQHNYSEATTPALGENPGKAFTVTDAMAYTTDPVTSQNTPSPPVSVSQFETRPTNFFVNYLIKYTSQLPSLAQLPV
jgi:microcystin-dependent protein